jgi:hypothetical protein
MTSDRLRRRLESVVLRHPAGGWRAHARAEIEDWPDHALADLILERLDVTVGARVPPALARAAVGRLEFLELLAGRDQIAARGYLRALASASPAEQSADTSA